MGKIILCITDQPKKFRKLRQLTSFKNVVLITCCRYYHVEEYVAGPDEIVGVCVDFEAPFGTGPLFLKLLQNNAVPVVITETNKHGILRVKEALVEFGFPNFTVADMADDWEKKAFEFCFINLIPEANKLSELIFSS